MYIELVREYLLPSTRQADHFFGSVREKEYWKLKEAQQRPYNMGKNSHKAKNSHGFGAKKGRFGKEGGRVKVEMGRDYYEDCDLGGVTRSREGTGVSKTAGLRSSIDDNPFQKFARYRDLYLDIISGKKSSTVPGGVGNGTLTQLEARGLHGMGVDSSGIQIGTTGTIYKGLFFERPRSKEGSLDNVQIRFRSQEEREAWFRSAGNEISPSKQRDSPNRSPQIEIQEYRKSELQTIKKGENLTPGGQGEVSGVHLDLTETTNQRWVDDAAVTEERRKLSNFDEKELGDDQREENSGQKSLKLRNLAEIENEEIPKIGLEEKIVSESEDYKEASGEQEELLRTQRKTGGTQTSKNIDYKKLDNLDPDCFKYEGNKRDGVFDGYGHFTFDDGSRFYGNFSNGLPHGKGTFFRAGIHPIDGYWLNGLFQGEIEPNINPATA